MNESVHGRFLWFEVLCRDPAVIRDFYTQVCDWTITAWPMGPGMTYEMFTAGGVPIGGIHPFPAGTPSDHAANSHWLPYFASPDVDASVATLMALGGKVWVAPNTIPSVGRMAVVADRNGAEFAFHAPATPPPMTAPPPRVGDVAWVELSSPDTAGSLADYGALFGWTPAQRHEMGPNGSYQELQHEGRRNGGIYQPAGGTKLPSSWTCYVLVADIDAAFARATALGATVMMSPMTTPNGLARIAMLRDPEGAPFALQCTA